mgnify:CR=1 FL=1
MLTTVDKAIAGGVVSFLATEAATYLHIAIPADVQTAITGVIVALMVWLIPNKDVAA